jgi:hypothetical protein
VLLGIGFSPISRSDAQASDEGVFSILKQKCLQCHGESVQMSGLDLRTPESMLKGGASGPAVVPGNAEASLIYRRVAGLEKPAMPLAPLPPLTSQEVEIIKTWIDRGARAGATETQALTLLNNEFVLIQAKHLAERVMREAGGDPPEQIRVIYRIALSREPDKKELESFLVFLHERRERSGGDLGALTDLSHVMLNANEFVYIN